MTTIYSQTLELNNCISACFGSLEQVLDARSRCVQYTNRMGADAILARQIGNALGNRLQTLREAEQDLKRCIVNS